MLSGAVNAYSAAPIATSGISAPSHAAASALKDERGREQRDESPRSHHHSSHSRHLPMQAPGDASQAGGIKPPLEAIRQPRRMGAPGTCTLIAWRALVSWMRLPTTRVPQLGENDEVRDEDHRDDECRHRQERKPRQLNQGIRVIAEQYEALCSHEDQEHVE